MYCLPEEYIHKFNIAAKSGKIDPIRLNNLSSSERRDLLSGIIGKEHAQQVNLLFEKKLLLKNQEKAMSDWARQLTGLNKKEKDDISTKIKRMLAEKDRRIYDPNENEKFLNEITSDVYSRKYKTDVSLEEAQQITELSQDAKMARERLDSMAKTSNSEKVGINAEQVALDNYIASLKKDINKKYLINPLMQKGIGDKTKALVNNAQVSANFISENSRAIVASIDNSLWGRQGLRVLADPRYSKIWAKNFAKSWVDIKNTVFKKNPIQSGENILNGLKAEIYGRKNYLNGRYSANMPNGGAKGTKLDIGVGEEQFPTAYPSKIPVLGRLFEGSKVAYEAGAMRLRSDVADKVYAMAIKNGADLTNNKVVGDLNEIVNSMTGRGTFSKKSGDIERKLNNTFFSVKFLKSNIDYLTMPFRGSERISMPARRLAATNLLYTVSSTATFLKIAKELNPNDNKDIFNPISSNFGKIRMGKMTIDLSHGSGGMVIAAARIISQKSKNSQGKTSELGEYGKSDGMDILYDFTENKLAPVASVIKDIVKQKDFSGNKPTLAGEAKKLTVPITIQNMNQLKNENSAKQLLGLIADGLGFNVGLQQFGNEFKINNKNTFKIK
jgi:hypothetical protein